MERMSAEAMKAAFDAAQRELDARIDRLLGAHGGSWRAGMEALLMALDYRANQIAYGFVRRRLQR